MLRVVHHLLLAAFLASLGFLVYAFWGVYMCGYGGCSLAGYIVFLLGGAISSVLGIVFLSVRIYKLRREQTSIVGTAAALLLVVAFFAWIIWSLTGFNLRDFLTFVSRLPSRELLRAVEIFSSVGG